MEQSLLVTTSAEGLQPLGSAAQRSFELVTGAVRARLGEAHAAIFAEPVAAQHGDAIDWHAAVPGRAVRLSELGEAERAAVKADLAAKVADIRAEADRLAESAAPGDQRLAEALSNALEIPGEDMIYALRDGAALRPVLVHWAWLRDEQRAVRGVLSALVPRPVAAAPLAPVAEAVERKRSWGWLLWLGWLLLALMLGAILWLLVAPCGLWRTGPDFCALPPARIEAALTETRVAADEVAALERELALVQRGCQPGVPLVPEAPEAPAQTAPAPEEPGQAAPGEPERKAALERATERGAQPGVLTFLLEWQGASDVDLLVTCPAGATLSRDNRGDCDGDFGLEANADAASAVDDPVEQVAFASAPPGIYTVTARLKEARTAGEIPVILHLIRRDGPSQSYVGMVRKGGPDWTTTISISR